MNKHILLSVCLLAACGSKKENKSEGGGGAGATPAATPSAPAAPTAAPTAAAKLDCDKILPKAMQEKYFTSKGYTMKTPTPPPAMDWIGKCDFDPPKEEKPDLKNLKYGGSLDASCHENMMLSKKATLEALPKQFKEMKPIDGVPDSLAHETSGGWQFHAYDSDSNCAVSGLLPKEIDGPAFVKEWLAALPPK